MQIVSQLENQHKKEEARLKAMTEYLQLAGSRTKSEEEDGNEGEEGEDCKPGNDMNGHASPPASLNNGHCGLRADIGGGAGRNNGSVGQNGGGGVAAGGMNIFNTAAAFAALNNHQPQQHSVAAAGNPFISR